MQGIIGFALAGAILLHHARSGAGSELLLVAYWALALPVLGQELATLLRQYPLQRNTALRFLDPLAAAETAAAQQSQARMASPPQRTKAAGVALALRGVRVQAGGHVLLDDIALSVRAGAHVAVVGRSGAGKSTLLGLLLGWHRPVAGTISADGEPLADAQLAELRASTAWVDPSVYLWNRSLYDNITFGATGIDAGRLASALAASDLHGVLDRFPAGLSTPLGEAGGLVSGGEGQRVRLARAMFRQEARLVILDEPFRGLGRGQRAALLAGARTFWQHATLLCATHDIEDALGFDEVLVMEGGHIAESGAPRALAADTSSRFAALLRADRAALRSVWDRTDWRTLRVELGRITHPPAEEVVWMRRSGT
jgi:ATP-binding cassette subfamily B protein